MDAEDQVDSLEGWLVVKEGPFTDSLIPQRLTFMACWNEVKKMVAITCRLHNRVVSDVDECHCRSGMFSFQELKAIHDLLCHVHPSLEPFLPALPEEPRSLWTYLGYEDDSIDYASVCESIEEYLKFALEICKEKLLISTLFEYEQHSAEEYFENISEIRRQGYDDEICKSEEELNNVIFLRQNASHMNDMRDVYEAEDKAIFKLNIALAALYNYLLQPFLDLREVAYHKVMEAKEQLQNPNVGERIKREFSERFTEWQGQYEEALDNIQRFYVEYYGKTSNIYKEMMSRMEEDKTKFGKTAFDLIGRERYSRLREDYCLERLQLLQNEKKFMTQERDKVKEEIASIEDKPGAVRKLEQCEARVFSWQTRIYTQQMVILDEEEKLARSQMQTITYQIQEIEDTPVFYDAVEDLQELSSDEDKRSNKSTDHRIIALQNKLSSITRRRAKLRNLKAALERKHKDKEQKKKEDEQLVKHHHAIQMKRDLKREEEMNKKEFIDEERRKAIDRIRNHRIKFPMPETIKPPRYQSPSQKKDASKVPSSDSSDPIYNQTYTVQKPKGRPLTNSEKTIRIPSSKSKVGAKGTKCEESKDISGSKKRKSSPKSRDSVDSAINPEYSGREGSTPPISNSPLPSDLPEKSNCLQVPSCLAPPPPSVPPPPPPPPPPPAPPPPLSTKLIVKKAKPPEPPVTTKEEVDGPPSLSSILAGKSKLKPVGERIESSKPTPSANPMDDILGMIKQGVRLRPMKKTEDKSPKDSPESPETPSDSHLRLLQESLSRISHFTRDSSPESDSDSDHFFED